MLVEITLFNDDGHHMFYVHSLTDLQLAVEKATADMLDRKIKSFTVNDVTQD